MFTIILNGQHFIIQNSKCEPERNGNEEVTPSSQELENYSLIVGDLTKIIRWRKLLEWVKSFTILRLVPVCGAYIPWPMMFELGMNAVEATETFIVRKVEGAIDHSSVTRWFKKFFSRCKNLDNQSKSVRPKTVDSETVGQIIEAFEVSYTERISGKHGITHSGVVCRLYDHEKASGTSEWYLPLRKCCKTFNLPY